MKMKFAALDLMLMFGCLFSLPAQAQTACSNASLSGMYFYLVSGPYAITTTGSSPYAELGKFVADGNGGLSGQSVASLNGSVTPYTFTGSYAVAGDCTGTLTLTFAGTQSPRAYPIAIVDGGRGAVILFQTPNESIDGRIYAAASRGVSQCGNASLSGSYGYLLSGVWSEQGGSAFYSHVGQLVASGNGGISASGVVNVGTGGIATGSNGTYSIASDCSGTVMLSDSKGTYNFTLLSG